MKKMTVEEIIEEIKKSEIKIENLRIKTEVETKGGHVSVVGKLGIYNGEAIIQEANLRIWRGNTVCVSAEVRGVIFEL